MGEMNFAVAVLIGFGLGLVMALLAYLVRRVLWQLMAGLNRALLYPFRPILRALGLSKRVWQRAEGPASVALAQHTTITDTALGDDFEHERSFMQRQGLFFRWMNARVGFMRMPEELDDELAQDYYRQAQDFLGTTIPIGSDPHALFEDIEGGVIATQFYESDKGILFYMNETRKLMNDNVRKLSLWFSFILTSVLALNIIANDVGMVQAIGLGMGVEFLPLGSESLNSLAFGIASCVIAAVLMWALYYTEYTPYQRNTAREMANILTRYLARVNDHYRTAVGRARSVTVGEEREPARLAEQAKLWTTNLTWIALRTYFVESYIRNVAFQIRRNSSYYLMFVPAAFTLVVVFLIILAGMVVPDFDPIATIASLGFIFPCLFVLTALLYALFLLNAMAALEEIDQGEWISFHTLKLDEVLGDVVGKYAEDVGYWKNRVGGGL
jgi:hypothetical protein